MSTGNCRKLLYLDSWLAFSRFLSSLNTKEREGARASSAVQLVCLHSPSAL